MNLISYSLNSDIKNSSLEAIHFTQCLLDSTFIPYNYQLILNHCRNN